LICWYKGSTGCSAYIGFNDWEPHLVYGKTSGICMHDYFYANNTEKMGNYGHPCPKPISWAEWFISRATKKGDLVCDTFSGSGTTLIAAHGLQRNYIGFEIDKDYFEAAQKRIAKAKSQVRITDLIEHTEQLGGLGK